MRKVITTLLVPGLALALSAAMAQDVEKSNGQSKEQISPPTNQGGTVKNRGAPSRDQAKSKHKRDHHSTEQSSAGDQGTVNESQDPLTSQTTPHDKLEANQPKNADKPATK